MNTFPTLTRRDFLRGMAALPCLAHLGSAARGDRALILIWCDGGMSHIDTFDGKPEAPADIRGALRSVEAALDGVFVSEHLPRLGALMRRCVLLRSITHGEGNHDRGTHFLLTGRRPSPVLAHPSLGAVLAANDAGDTLAPAYVCIPDAPDYGGSGFLPETAAPFEVGTDPAAPGSVLANLRPRPELARSLALLDEIDRLDGAPRSASEAARDRFAQRARALAEDERARALFALDAEPPAMCERYGRHRLGRSALLARRLADSGGARVVLVRDTGWDHHVGIERALGRGFPPKLTALDQAVSALIEDLDERGASERIAICVASEFGRTPRLNPAAGRDHWARAQSVLLFGAGLRRGVALGRTDARGEEPVDQPLSPADLFATLLTLLGDDPARMLQAPGGRPVRLAEDGAAPIREILAP
jgi:uncharacterized protein (DUF1501 family)